MAKKLHPLRSYRIKHGLSCGILAGKLKVAESTLRSLENGHRRLTAELAVEIEKRLGINRAILRPDLFIPAA